MNPVSLTPIFARIFDAMDRKDQANAYVLSGCIASAHGAASLQVDVTSGIIVTGAGAPASPGAQNVTPGALVNPLASRCDLIYFPSGSTVLTLAAGVEVVVAPNVPAIPPALPAGACAIAVAYIVPGAIDYSGATQAFVENIQQNGVAIPYFGPTGPWASTGDIRLRNTAEIRARDSTNTFNERIMLYESSNFLLFGGAGGTLARLELDGTGIRIGTPSGSNAAGGIGITNNADIVARNNGNTNDITLIRANTSDQVVINAGGAGITLNPATAFAIGTNPSSAGILRLPSGNGQRISFRNNANTGEGASLESDGSDQAVIRQAGTLLAAFGATYLALGASAAGAGILRLPNALYVNSRNAANTGNLAILGVAADDIMRLWDSRVAAQQTATTTLADGTGHMPANKVVWTN